MTDNPLRSASTTNGRVSAPSDPAERQRFWIERGNSILWGHQPDSKGEWPTPRRDLEWACANGSYFLQPRRQPERPRLIDTKMLAAGDA